ncbi:hypothetical protein ANN_07153 [Periplaneta americana]|uniref:Cell cycle checkpoint control protein n=1 Tax=Periplaneta americana TaxID=6978 RepID=A0ABQ8TFG2_PERAM|nr:hypothetical protein ANN_07153 [Periplaneta americana]
MKCIIPGLNVKARAIHALCRIGDELYVEPEPSKISFRAVSSAKSAYASFTFSENFFSYYNYEHTDSQDDVTCKISMKSCLAVFKSPGHMDKQVEACQIRLEPDGVKLIFEFQCYHGIVKTHYLPIIECETLEAVYSKDMVPNRFMVQPKVMSFGLMNFQANTPEITLIVTPQKMHLRNYAEDDSELKKSVRTELCLEAGEFDHYSIGVDTSVTFCLREFRALLMFAEAVSLPITANFETGGRPIVFVVKNPPTFETNFVFATLMPLSINQLNSSQRSSASSKQSSKDSAAKKRSATSNANIHDVQIAGPSRTNRHEELIENDSEGLERMDINENSNQDNGEHSPEEDTVPGTPPPPPSKKIRYIFQRCFEPTFDSEMLPGYDEVLAEDSDEEAALRT